MTATLNAQVAASSVEQVPVAHCGQNYVRDTEGLRNYMRSYAPYMAARDWARVRPFVLDCVLPIPVGSEEGARQLLRPLSRLAHWAQTTASLPLDKDIILDADTINQFIATLPREKARTYQGALFTVARSHGGDNTDRAVTFGNRVEPPYTDDELGQMASFVSSLTRPDDIRTANAAMGACGGAGLRRRELVSLTRGSLTRTAAGWSIRVGGDWPRTVPVLDRWNTYIDRAVESIDDPDALLVPATGSRTGSDRLERLNRRARNTNSFGPDCQRLRSTWVVKVLNLLTPGELLHIAGYSNTEFLRFFAPYLTRRPDSVIEPTVRGAETEATR
jgi:integrase